MSKSKSNTAETIIESNNEAVVETTPVVEVKAAPQPNEMIKELKTKSAVIRALAAQGFKTNQIYKMLVAAKWHSDRNPSEPIRYQHVRTVLNQPLVGKKKPAEATA